MGWLFFLQSAYCFAFSTHIIDETYRSYKGGKRKRKKEETKANLKRLGNTTYPVVKRETSAEYLHSYKDLPGLKGDYARKCFIYLSNSTYRVVKTDIYSSVWTIYIDLLKVDLPGR